MLSLLRFWILLSACLSTGGWVLSAFGVLNRIGYLCVLGASLLLFSAYFVERPITVRFKRWRFRQTAPALYLLLAAAAILGGFLYLPVNVDGYSYRIPRVLHWLGAQQWHWIHSADIRLNVVATQFDWLSAPLLLFFKSERSIPLINAVSFLLLPGATFLALAGLGVRRRVAWWWMWILPAGFCYCMQAGSIANDMFAAIYTLSAIGFAVRTLRTHDPRDLWISLLSIALASGSKQTNLPLGLPWLIAAVPSLHLLPRRFLGTTLMLILALGGSVIPISLLNIWHGFPWQGFLPGTDFAPKNAFWGIVGNSFWIPFNELQPPIIPWAGKWNQIREQFLESDWGAPFRSFEVFAHLQRAASEQYSGIGCTVLVFLLVVWFVARGGAQGKIQISAPDRIKWIRWSIWLGLFVFMAKVGINQNPRYLAPYYPLLAASFLLGSQQRFLVKTKWWRRAAPTVILISVGLIMLSRQRPLFPVETLLKHLPAGSGGDSLMRKVVNSFNFANRLRSEITPLLKEIPADEKLLGYATRAGDKEPWFWKPLFSRRVLRISNNDPPESVNSAGFRYVVVDPSVLTPEWSSAQILELDSPRTKISSIEEWLRVYHAELVSSVSVHLKPDMPPARVCLARFKN
ncbi:MAG TPA: hypothetical protein VGR78_17870 [Verrucomicrobiae bacterium]|nr:hypothetical protein [Verrucomicrobiae bacterium]